MVRGHEVSSVEATIDFSINVVRPPIISAYEIGKRGRYIAFAPVMFGGRMVELRIVHKGQLPGPSLQLIDADTREPIVQAQTVLHVDDTGLSIRLNTVARRQAHERLGR